MNKQAIISSLLVFVLCGCSGSSSRSHEKAIADFVQTDKKGVWTDLKFKVIEMGAPTDITVGDSIRILTDVFEADKAKKIEFANESIERNRTSLEKERLSVMRKFHQDHIDKQQKIIDSLMVLEVKLPQSYTTKHSNDVLAKEILCKFSIVNPLFNTKQEETRIFILNAEGDKCLRSKSAKK